MTEVNFKPIADELTTLLIPFAMSKNIGKSIEIDGKKYVLDYVSVNKNQFFKSRGFSAYFRIDRSVIRISDHWSETRGNDRSRKLNCGRVGDAVWKLNNDPNAGKLSVRQYAGKYPFEVLAGKAGLSKLNKSVEHWL